MVSIETLKQVRDQLSLEIVAIDKALIVLGNTQKGIAAHPNGSNSQQHKKRTWSKAQREAMAATQRKRWKELRAKQKAGA